MILLHVWCRFWCTVYFTSQQNESNTLASHMNSVIEFTTRKYCLLWQQIYAIKLIVRNFAFFLIYIMFWTYVAQNVRLLVSKLGLLYYCKWFSSPQFCRPSQTFKEENVKFRVSFFRVYKIIYIVSWRRCAWPGAKKLSGANLFCTFLDFSCWTTAYRFSILIL